MKLYYSAGSCSTSCHITLEEAGLKYEAIEVDWDNPQDPHASEALRLNPLGTLPVFVTDSGEALTQNVAIHTYVADQDPEHRLLPSSGMKRAQVMNWMSFVAADLHKSFGPLFGLSSISKNETTQTEVRNWAVKNINQYLEFLNESLAGKDYLTGQNFTVADAYCFVVLGWTKGLKIPTGSYHNVEGYLKRVYERPAVQRVLKAEGLLE
jgi:glutathione S-transferase